MIHQMKWMLSCDIAGRNLKEQANVEELERLEEWVELAYLGEFQIQHVVVPLDHPEEVLHQEHALLLNFQLVDFDSFLHAIHDKPLNVCEPVSTTTLRSDYGGKDMMNQSEYWRKIVCVETGDIGLFGIFLVVRESSEKCICLMKIELIHAIIFTRVRDRENPSSELHKDSTLEASIRRFKASSGNLLHQEGSWNIGEDFPNRGVVGDDTLAEEAVEIDSEPMASRGRRGGAPACEDEPRRDERAEQQAPAPQGHVLPPPPPVDYGVFMQGLVQAMQTQAHTQAALQAQLEAQKELTYGGIHCCVPGLSTELLMLLGTNERRKTKKFVMGLKPSLRTRLVAFDHRTLDEALSAACRQEGKMEQYLEEKKASQKRPAATFQRQDKKKAVYPTQQRSVVVGSTQDEILEVDKYHWLGWRLVLPVCAVQESSMYCLGIVGDDTLADEAVEIDSERKD
ncbi:hypothetical protein Taro_019606 [Colocasia esculenta]|uniref:Uncharacterized protein n=1 Tax=Colocasia esculenta TaxID=4460 RepID=A0A843UU77_COLES|nr:hypothetical protein [Colocasia esculenta]